MIMNDLNGVKHHPKRIAKADQDFAINLDLKDTKFPVQFKDTNKVEKKNPSALVFLVMKNTLIYY